MNIFNILKILFSILYNVFNVVSAYYTFKSLKAEINYDIKIYKITQLRFVM